MSLRQTAFTSILWSALEHGSTTVISFLSLIVFTRLLEPRDFGAFSIALSIIEIAGIFTNMFFYEALIQSNKIGDEHFDGAFTVSVVLSILFFGLLWVTFPLLASFLGDPLVSDLGKVLGVGLLITGPLSAFTARQSREFGFRVLALRSLIGRIVGAALGIAAALYHFGVWALVIQNLSMVVLGSIALVALSTSRPRLTANWRPVTGLLYYCFGSIVALSATFVTKRAFMFFVGVFLGVETAGFLNLAFRLVDTVWSISVTAISQVMLPVLARLQEDKGRVLRAYNLILILGCGLLYPVFAGIGAVAPELIRLMFGDRWIPAAQPTLWLSLMVFMQLPGIFQASLLKMTGNIHAVRSADLVELTCMVVGTATTKLPNETLALIVWSGTGLVNVALLTGFVRHRLNLSSVEQLRHIVVPLLASCVMVATVALARAFLQSNYSAQLHLFSLCVIGLVTYVGLILLFGRSLIANVLEWMRLPTI